MEDVCEDNSVPLQLLESMTADDQTQQESAAPAPPPPVYCQASVDTSTHCWQPPCLV